MAPITIILWGLLVPGAMALLAALMTLRFAARMRWLLAVGVGGAYVAGQLGIVGWQAFDGDITHGLVVLALAGALIGVFESRLEHAGFRWALRVTASLAAAWLLLRPLLPAQLWGLGVPSNAISALWWPGLSFAFLIVWGALDQLAGRDEARLLPALLVLLSVCGGATVFFAGNATTGLLSAPLAATSGAVFIVGIFRPRLGFLRPAVPAMALLMVGQWSIGHFYTDNMSLVSVALLVGGPMLLVLALPFVPRTRRVLAIALQIVVLGLPAGAAAGMAAISYFSPPPAALAPAASNSAASSSANMESKSDDYGY